MIYWGSGTYILDLGVGGGWLELEEDDVEDRHRVGGRSFVVSLVNKVLV
jgi:hypothetical protein